MRVSASRAHPAERTVLCFLKPFVELLATCDMASCRFMAPKWGSPFPSRDDLNVWEAFMHIHIRVYIRRCWRDLSSACVPSICQTYTTYTCMHICVICARVLVARPKPGIYSNITWVSCGPLLYMEARLIAINQLGAWRQLMTAAFNQQLCRALLTAAAAAEAGDSISLKDPQTKPNHMTAAQQRRHFN